MGGSMTPPDRYGAWPRTAAWLGISAAMVLIVVLKLEVSFDLSAFLPSESDLSAEVLLEQLSSGPGSRMMVIGINGGEESDRIETGRLVRQRLSEDSAFTAVFNGEWDLDTISVPEPVKSAYPLMADIDYSSAALREALLARLANLAFGGGKVLRSLVARDPYFVTLDLMRRLAPTESSGAAWLAEDGSAVVTAQTRSPGVDLQAQQLALDTVRDAFSELRTDPALTLDVTGVGAFGLELQSIIQQEARKLGILAGSAILLVVLVVYRNLRLALLAGLPLGIGYLAGMTAVSLVFETTHGITLAFGFTLLGVAVDYPLHLFSHAGSKGGASAIRSIWPTLRLGAATTATAYLAMVLSGSQGLSQLGLFTAAGVAVAVLVTRTWLPALLKNGQQAGTGAADPIREPARRFAPGGVAILAGCGALYLLSPDGLWNDAMATLSPVPESRIQADQRLRSATGSADLRYQVMIAASDLNELLRETERVDGALQSAADKSLLRGWSSITTLLASRETQAARIEAIPAPTALADNLRAALAGTAFLEPAFAPFLGVVNGAPARYPLTPAAFDHTPLDSWRDAHLLNISGQWVAVVALNAPEPGRLAPLVEQWGEAVRWVDLNTASNELMRDFRHRAGWAVALAALVIVSLLLLQRVGFRRLLWVACTVTAALSITVCIVLLVHGYLTLVHMVALLLVLGLGLDYSLFFSRPESGGSRRATAQSIVACAASTALAFAILSTSSIPLLRFIGLTVATGSIANLAIAWLGSWRTQPNAPGRRTSG